MQIKDIILDGGIQSRDANSTLTIDEYIEALNNGAVFPPVIIFFDNEKYWLADGFHRVEAYKKAGKTEIEVDIRQGTRRDAILYSVGANAAHGLKRSPKDKRKAVKILLEDSEWNLWSDREIARQCKVSNRFVSNLRSDLTVNVHSEKTYITKHGTIATMNTTNIGKTIPVAEEKQVSEEIEIIPKIEISKSIVITEPKFDAAANIAPEIREVIKENELPNKDIERIAKMQPEQQIKIIEKIDTGEAENVIEAQNILQQKDNEFNNIGIKQKPHVNFNSGNNEWYTPEEYIVAAKNVLNEIELDPASNEIANEIVQAKKYYSIEDDGLNQNWQGKVWLNPPYATGLIEQFSNKLIQHYKNNDIEEAIVLVNNATETNWFNILIEYANAIIFPKTRIKFRTSQGILGSPLQGQAIIYLGDNSETFLTEFSKFGWGGFIWKRE